MTEVIIVARNQSIADIVHECAVGSLTFSDLCERISQMGYKTTSLYEMVCAEEESLATPTRPLPELRGE